MHALKQRLVLTLEPVHDRLALVDPLLRGVVPQGEHAHAGREVTARADLAAELEQCLFQLFDTLELFLRCSLCLLEC